MDVKCTTHVKRINIFYDVCDGTYCLSQDRSFNSMDSLLNYYTSHPPHIKRKGKVLGGQLSLKKPLVIATDRLRTEANVSEQGLTNYFRSSCLILNNFSKIVKFNWITHLPRKSNVLKSIVSFIFPKKWIQ